MTSSSWQTARHRITTPTAHYTLRFAHRVYSAVVCGNVRAAAPRLGSGRCGGGLTAALVACVGVLTGSAQAPVFQTGVDVVTIGVTVTDSRGQLVTGLRAEDFEIYEDGRRQHLGLLLDVSESMGDDLRFTQTAAIKFLNTLTSAADITVMQFDSEIRAARYTPDEFPRLVERIRQQKATGLTALYDAIGVYLDGAAEQTGRKVMLLYTDGGDTRSSLRYTELLDLLKASDVTVYVIGSLSRQTGGSRERARSVLQTIAAVTGGQAFFPTTLKDLDRMYESVVAEIRAQYTLGYVSDRDRADGAWRSVEIRLPGRKGLRVRARKGYFAPYRKP